MEINWKSKATGFKKQYIEPVAYFETLLLILKSKLCYLYSVKLFCIIVRHDNGIA